jgi:phospholipid transport system substrate-binding protein
MNLRVSSLGWMTGLLLFTLRVGPAPAMAPSASDAVRTALAEASALGDADLSRTDRLEALRVMAHELVDTRAMGIRAIGQSIADQPPEQREEFLRLFDELIVRSYLQKLLLFRNPQFRFTSEARRGGVTIVHTQVMTPKDTYDVTYEMHQRDGRWLASNIYVEGVSLMSSYSTQFAGLLRDRSFEDLLDLMRRKVDGFRTRDGA